MEQPPTISQEEKQKRPNVLNRKLGRRTSDWVMPVLFWLIGFAGLLSAIHFYRRTVELESLSATRAEQVRLLEQKIKLLEKAK